jgi:NADPH-dependent glutamate synthase beta subunit-like oxidoreductase/CO/xanthine dehydrogenase FAD-binding subunit
MKYFNHANAKTVKDAVRLLKEHEGKAKLIAGGTDLLGILKDRILPDYPEILINLKTIRKLNYIEEDSGELRIGAMTKLSDLAESVVVKKRCQVLADTAGAVATPQIRNLGTIGGNLCQEVRCWYYRYPHSIGGEVLCARKRADLAHAPEYDTCVGGKGCSALTGENRYHSIFGASKVGDPPCTMQCPASINIPYYMSKLREGDLKEAAKRILETNPMPAITGRVCPHYCQEACNRRDYDEALYIRAVERFIGDYVLDNACEFVMAPENETGKAVAVVGSGPAGLSAAFYLRKSGHRVTVLDRMDEPGGMLSHAIPAFRLPGDCVRRLIEAYRTMGIEFRLKVCVGKDISLEKLRKEFDCIFLATGAWSAPSIDLDGEDLTTPGLSFLIDVRRGIRENPGKRVLVIGGGNVAVDVGITARRLGAERVTLACLESREEMPALAWEIEKALEEGVKLMPSWNPSRVFESNKNELSVDLVRCVSVFDENGHFAPVCDHSVKKTLEVDRVFLAVGQKPDLSYIPGRSRIKTVRDLIVVHHETRQTTVRGIFAGGDVTSGPGTVVGSIAAGRRAAMAMDRFLLGDKKQTAVEMVEKPLPLLTFNTGCVRKADRFHLPERPVHERRVDIEDALELDLGVIRTEADRCFNCGCVSVNASDMAPVLVALDATIRTSKRTVSAEEFFSWGSVKRTLVDCDELVMEILIPDSASNRKLTYEKFRIRKSIDFPIIAVASGYEMEGGKFKDVRIVLGAVAPIPMRLKDVETFLRGKEPSQQVADQAAAIAAQKALPLKGNAYKVQIMKTLLKRSILAAPSR